MSDKYEITGAVHLINPTQTFSSGFSKREIVIATLGEYQQLVKFEFMKEDGCARLDAYAIGDTVKISFNVRGNEYQGKYYVSLAGWKIERTGEQPAQPARSPNQSGAEPPSTTATDDSLDEEDQIPF